MMPKDSQLLGFLEMMSSLQEIQKFKNFSESHSIQAGLSRSFSSKSPQH
jgi:hypothetical protein